MSKSLSDRMKEYEAQSKTSLLKRTPVIIRLDGKAFHSFTRGFGKPFDVTLSGAMHHAMLDLCKNIQGCVFGYTQSDEITLVLKDWQNLDTCAWFDNQVQKICSISASMCTNYFNEWLYVTQNVEDLDHNLYNLLRDKRHKAVFDARAFNLPTHEVVNCLIWRQQDAIRNSISAVAQHHYSQKQLDGKKSEELLEMIAETGRKWDEYASYNKYGACCYKNDDDNWVIDLCPPKFKDNKEFVEKWLR